jgi:Domain of unknown function (DU1801).
MAENKTQPTKASVAAFIDAIPDEARRSDARTLVELMRTVTGEKPVMWGPSIIGFGSYRYKYDSGREGEMPVIGFSPRKSALVLYNMGGFSGSEALRSKLGENISGSGCLYIKKLASIDLQVLENLMRKSAEAIKLR